MVAVRRFYETLFDAKALDMPSPRLELGASLIKGILAKHRKVKAIIYSEKYIKYCLNSAKISAYEG